MGGNARQRKAAAPPVQGPHQLTGVRGEAMMDMTHEFSYAFIYFDVSNILTHR